MCWHCWYCTDISFTDSIIDITQYSRIPLPLYEGATDIWGLPNRPMPLTSSQYLPMNCDIYRSSPGVYCMVLFPTCNKNLPIVSTAFQWHPQYNKLKARVSQSHKVRPIIHTQWQDANLSFAKRFPIPNKIYNFMCENVNSFTDSDKELLHSWFSWDRFGKSANKAYKYIELSPCFIGRSSIAIIWQNILGNCLTGIINISLRTKATNAKVCEVSASQP